MTAPTGPMEVQDAVLETDATTEITDLNQLVRQLEAINTQTATQTPLLAQILAALNAQTVLLQEIANNG